jgi:hypothetical protein
MEVCHLNCPFCWRLAEKLEIPVFRHIVLLIKFSASLLVQDGAFLLFKVDINSGERRDMS